MPDTEPLPIPEPPDNSRIEFTHDMRVYAAWSSSAAAVANGYEPEERWRLYGHMAAWMTWGEFVETYGESLRSLVLLKPHFPPEPLRLSEVERAALMTDFHFSTCNDRKRCPDCAHKVKEYRAVIAAVSEPIAERAREEHLLELGAAGRLHPHGSTMAPEFRIDWLDVAGKVFSSWSVHSLEGTRELLAEPRPSDVAGFKVVTREHWVSPWVAVPEEALKPVDEPEGQQ